MKKILVLLMLIGCFSLVGCSSDSKEELGLEKEIVIKDKVKFKVTNVAFEKRIVPINSSAKDYPYISLEDKNALFLDVELKVENTSTKDIKVKDIFESSFTVDDKVYKNSKEVYLEKGDYNDLIKDGTLKPKEVGIVHIVTSTLAKNRDDKYQLELKINDVTYAVDVKSNLNKNTTKLDQVLSEKDKFNLTIHSIYTSDNVIPSNAKDDTNAYYYYSLKDQGSTFIIAKTTVENTGTTPLDIDKVAYLKAIVDDNVYPIYGVIETENHVNFEDSITIELNTSRTVYYLTEIPKESINKIDKLEIYLNGKNYTLNVAK